MVLAPQFDTATLQEIRALVTECSSMRIFLRGEVFELWQRGMAVLLEGFVRQEHNTEIITAPAGLVLKTPLLSPAGQSVSCFCFFPYCKACFHGCSSELLSWKNLTCFRAPKL